MKKPYVFINCAMSLDGKISSPSGKQMKISCEEDMKRVFNLRNESDAILVGINTILSDDPKLTVKEKYVKNPTNPIRVVLDSDCRTPIDSLVVNDTAKTIIFTTIKCEKKYDENVEIIAVEKTNEGFLDLEKILSILFEKGIKKLMVEGGSTVIGNFIKQGLANDLFIYVGSLIIGGKNTPSIMKNIDFQVNLNFVETKKIGSGNLLHYTLVK